jgi:transcriptional regulator with XRE-family HTH domain
VFVKLPLAPGVRDATGVAWTRGALVREFLTHRDGSRLSVAEVSRRSGVSKATIKRVMYGISNPQFKTGAKLVRALGQPNSWLVGYLERVKVYRTKKPQRRQGVRREPWQDVITSTS